MGPQLQGSDACTGRKKQHLLRMSKCTTVGAQPLPQSLLTESCWQPWNLLRLHVQRSANYACHCSVCSTLLPQVYALRLPVGLSGNRNMMGKCTRCIDVISATRSSPMTSQK